MMKSDSLDSGGLVGAGSTLDKNRTQSDESALKQFQQMLTNNNIASKTLNNTQARRDLADLELVYQNLAGINDSGLNTMMRTTGLNDNEEEYRNSTLTNRHQNKEQDTSTTEQTSSGGIGMQTIRAIRNELENRELQSILKEIEMQSKKKDAPIPKRRRELYSNKKSYEFEKTSNKKHDEYDDDELSSGWPPKKYEHVKSTGYGTSWSPASFKKSKETIADDEFTKKRKPYSSSFIRTTNRSTSRSKSETRSIKRDFSDKKRVNYNLSNESVYYSSKGSLHGGESVNKEKYYAQINDLKNELIDVVNDHEAKIKELRLDYEKQLNALRTENVQLKDELKDKNDRENISKSIFGGEKDEEETVTKQSSKMKSSNETSKNFEQMKKKLDEQELLLRGYQFENEKLYSEIKELKEANRRELNKYEQEKQQLKFDLIQEKKIVHERKSSPSPKPSTPNLDINKFMPSNEPTAPKNETIESYEQQIRLLEQRLNDANALSRDLRSRAENYEQIKQQLAADMRTIDAKNKEIKNLNEKLRLLEMGKTAPECLKDLRLVKNQLKEMDLLVKRLRRPISTQTGNGTLSSEANVNISLDFYEKRIEKLEGMLREKTADLERLNCLLGSQTNQNVSGSLNQFWPDGVVSNVNVRKIVKVDASSLESNQNKIDILEKSNLKLRNMLANLENELALKKSECQKLNTELEATKKIKSYEPTEFLDVSTNNEHGNEFWKNIYAEVERLKVKLANADNELKLREKEFELKQIHSKHTNEKMFNELISRHKYEINKLIGLLTGDELLSAKNLYDGESLLDDPIRMRLILNSRNKYLSLTQTIDKQKEIINGLNEKLNYFKKNSANNSHNSSLLTNTRDDESLEDVVSHYETQLKLKNREIEKFRNELDQMLNLLKTLQT